MAEEQTRAVSERLKVFVSYSRSDIDFADQLVLALADKGFEPLLDRHDIDAAEKWKDRLGALITSCDTVAFVLSEKSASSPICQWEVEQAARLGKRMIPVVPRDPGQVTPPPQLGELNYILFYPTPSVPGSGFYDGVQRLDRALRVNLTWLRRQTTYAEQAAIWSTDRSDDRLLSGKPLEEALQWRAGAPAGIPVAPLVLEYLAAGDAVAARRKAEADANIAEREAALVRARRATTLGLGVAVALIILAGTLSWVAATATRDANENRASIFTIEADTRISNGQYAEAMLIALAGDPAAQHEDVFQRLVFARAGHAQARTALAAAFAQNRLLRVVVGPDLGAVALFSNQRRVLTFEGGIVFLRDVASGRVLHTFGGHLSGISSAALSPDGARVLTGSRDGTARLWDAASGRVLQTFNSHQGAISSVAFSPDGAHVVTGSNDGTVRLWDAASGRELQTFSGDQHAISSLAFSPDGARLLTGSFGGPARLWTINPIILARPDDQVRMACATLRNLHVTRYSDTDLERFPILQHEPRDPCSGVG